MNKSGSFRKKKINFTQVSNFVLLDDSLSLKAKGLFSLIQHYITIPDFILYKNTLKGVCKEKDKAFDSTWNELKKAGYLVQYKMRDKENKRFYYEYELLDKPHPQKADVEKAGSGKATCGKGGVYNKTDLTNTDSNNTYIKDTKLYEHLENAPVRGNYKNMEEFVNHISEYQLDRELQLELLYFYRYYLDYNNGYNHYRLTNDALEKCMDNLNKIIEHINNNPNMTMEDYREAYFDSNARHNLKTYTNPMSFNYLMSSKLHEFTDPENYFEPNGELKDYIEE